MEARKWLLENGYQDIAKTIDEIIDEWHSQGLKTRRNWWDILAGSPSGNPRAVAGREFPILKAARKRQGLKPIKNAISRQKREKAPPIN